MTTETKSGVITFCCDQRGCRKNFESGEDEFRAAWADAREHGWVNAQGATGWKHYCPQHKHIVGD